MNTEDALNEIEALQAERDRLREALDKALTAAWDRQLDSHQRLKAIDGILCAALAAQEEER